MVSFDELNPLEQFILRHDVPHLTFDQVRDISVLQREVAGSGSMITRIRLRKQMQAVLYAHSTVADLLRRVS